MHDLLSRFAGSALIGEFSAPNLSRLDGAEIIGLASSLCFFTVIALIAVAWIVSSQWRRIRETELRTKELAFKQELLDRGMSPDEIKQLLEVAGHPPQRSG